MEQLLEEVKINVQHKFNEIRAALHMREKLLLRQLEVIANTQQQQAAPVHIENNGNKDKTQCEVRFFTGTADEEVKLLQAIRGFGQFQLDSNMQLALHRTQDNMTAGLRNEDYIEPMDDHETMYKCLEDGEHNAVSCYDEEVQPEAIVVDFSRSKALLEDNQAKRSIINITLQEAKDLIHRAKIKRETYVPPLNLEELDDELESSIADAVSSLGRSCSEQPSAAAAAAGGGKQSKPKTRKPRLKPKITINNCNGTINLRNIASLTINCASEDAVSAKLPLILPQSTAAAESADSPDSSSSCSNTEDQSSSSNCSSTTSSRSQSKKTKVHKNQGTETSKAKRQLEEELEQDQQVASSTNTTETHDVTCDFYNRLLNEIKKSLKEKPQRVYIPESTATTTETTATATVTSSVPLPTVAPDSSCDTNCNTKVSSTQSRLGDSTISSQLQTGKRLILKNFENLKIILEANSGDEDSFHPVQIEQWLAEIISETDLEPMQNTDILEHSKIDNSESNS